MWIFLGGWFVCLFLPLRLLKPPPLLFLAKFTLHPFKERTMEKFLIPALMQGIDGAWIYLFLFSKSASECSHLFFFPDTEWSASFGIKVLLEEDNLRVSVLCPEVNLNCRLGDLYTN